MKKKYTVFTVIGLLILATIAFAGMNDRFSKIELEEDNYIAMPEITTAPSTPDSGWASISVRANNIYFKDDAGTETALVPIRQQIVQLASVFVDGEGPITKTSAPNCTTIDNVGAIVWDSSGEVAEIQFTHIATAAFTGLTVKLPATSSVATGSEQAVDWSIFVQTDGSNIGTVVAQTGAAYTEAAMNTKIDEVTLTLDATGIAAVTAGSSTIHIAIWNNGTSDGTLELKGIKVREL